MSYIPYLFIVNNLAMNREKHKDAYGYKKICFLSTSKDQGHLQKGYSHKSFGFFSLESNKSMCSKVPTPQVSGPVYVKTWM